ncbi:MAG: radical SAM protein [Gammaproteobacteria bacterium]|nr:radical SAM protein [Gammaproteobacteria bacterium]MCH9743610.1 radical SAM protein [Gammaproteobacteria bacterium]
MSIDKKLGVVLKTVERCNINCSYCYFFHGGDDSYQDHPIYISDAVIKNIGQFLHDACVSQGIAEISIGLHGGEPLMQKKHQLDAMCSYFYDKLSPVTKLSFTLQTNGMLIDSDWIELFCKHRIGVGISIDGPKEYHDKYRVDHLGRGTYDRVVEKLLYTSGHRDIKEMGGVGILGVINTNFDAAKIYRHFIDDLNQTHMDFLLPDITYMHGKLANVEDYGKFLCDLFDEWAKDDDPNINVRYLNSTLHSFCGGFSSIYGTGPAMEDEIPLITISSNGDLSPVDELRVTNPKMFNGQANVVSTSLEEFLEKMPVFHQIKEAQQYLPNDCQECCWQHVCTGGNIVHRYSDSGFDNPSIYCDALKKFYAHVAGFLVSTGRSKEAVFNAISSPRQGKLTLDGAMQ